MNTSGNKLSFKTYNSVKVNETEISLPEFEKKEFHIGSRGDRLSDFDNDLYGISEDIVRLNEDKNNLYRSYRSSSDSEILDIRLSDDYDQLFDIHDIVCEPGDEISLLLNYQSDSPGEKFRSSMVRVHAKENSKVNIYMLSLDDKNTKIMESIYLKLEEEANVNLYEYRIGGRDVISNTRADLIGDGSDLNIDSIYFAFDEDKLDLHYDMIHHGRESKSDLMINGAMKDNAFKQCKTNLDFKRGSSKSDGSEEEHVILLSDNAHSQSVPILLAAEDDVSGNHAASSGKLDQAMIYYIMTRGLSKSEAESLVINSLFASSIDALATLDDKAYRDSIWTTVKEIME